MLTFFFCEEKFKLFGEKWFKSFQPFEVIGETSLIESFLELLIVPQKFLNFSNISFLSRKQPESPESRARPPIVEGRDGTPQKKKHCNCKLSRCLKL